MNKIRTKIIISCLLLFAVNSKSFSSELQQENSVLYKINEVPKQFRPLYNELEQELYKAENKINSLKTTQNTKSISSPSLYLASSYFGPIKKNTKRWKDIITTLDGFQSLGVKSVSFMISFPNLTAEISEVKPLLDSYNLLMTEIRKRDMKVVIEHFVYPSIAPTKEGKFVANIKNLSNPKKSFFDWKKEEIKIITSYIKPDYLSIISEPETYNKFLGLQISGDEYAQWIKSLKDDILKDETTKNIKIGAGAGIWESEDYINSFMKLSELDYIDIHFYPLKLKSEDMFSKLLQTLDKIKLESPSKEVIISETWLYKHGAFEPKGVYNSESYGRNVYDFWYPLDIRFFNLMNQVARKKGISVIAPYFSQYFFYTEKYNPDIAPQKWPISMMDEWEKATDNMKMKKLSRTGELFENIK